MWWTLIACLGTSECLWQWQCRVASCASSFREGWAVGHSMGDGQVLAWRRLGTFLSPLLESINIASALSGLSQENVCAGVLQRAEELTSLTALYQSIYLYKPIGHKNILTFAVFPNDAVVTLHGQEKKS